MSRRLWCTGANVIHTGKLTCCFHNNSFQNNVWRVKRTRLGNGMIRETFLCGALKSHGSCHFFFFIFLVIFREKASPSSSLLSSVKKKFVSSFSSLSSEKNPSSSSLSVSSEKKKTLFSFSLSLTSVDKTYALPLLRYLLRKKKHASSFHSEKKYFSSYFSKSFSSSFCSGEKRFCFVCLSSVKTKRIFFFFFFFLFVFISWENRFSFFFMIFFIFWAKCFFLFLLTLSSEQFSLIFFANWLLSETFPSLPIFWVKTFPFLPLCYLLRKKTFFFLFFFICWEQILRHLLPLRLYVLRKIALFFLSSLSSLFSRKKSSSCLS